MKSPRDTSKESILENLNHIMDRPFGYLDGLSGDRKKRKTKRHRINKKRKTKRHRKKRKTKRHRKKRKTKRHRMRGGGPQDGENIPGTPASVGPNGFYKIGTKIWTTPQAEFPYIVKEHSLVEKADPKSSVYLMASSNHQNATGTPFPYAAVHGEKAIARKGE